MAGRGPARGFLDAGNDQCIQFMKIHQVLHLECMLCTGLLLTTFQKHMFSWGLRSGTIGIQQL